MTEKEKAAKMMMIMIIAIVIALSIAKEAKVLQFSPRLEAAPTTVYMQPKGNNATI